MTWKLPDVSTQPWIIFKPTRGRHRGKMKTSSNTWPFCFFIETSWHDAAYDSVFLGNIPFLISDYRPPQILSAIARDRNRGEYLATSRRAGMVRTPDVATSRRAGMVRTPDEKGLIFDRNGDAHFRRDVYYSPDYTLATMTLDPNPEMPLGQRPGRTAGYLMDGKAKPAASE